MNRKDLSTVASLLPMMAAVFAAFLVTGLALPVLPLYVNNDLGLGAFVVGLVAGSQFTASLLSRFRSGNYADKHGGKRAVIVGLIMAMIAGLFYLASVRFIDQPKTSAVILILGRGLLGGAESFIITGALGWGLAIGGPQNAGKVIAWIGTAMYIAFAFGAPLGSELFKSEGFTSIGVATAVIPLITLMCIFPLRSVIPSSRRPTRVSRVIGAVWLPGLGLAFSSIGFGAITTFFVLLFAQHGWNQAWIGVTLFSIAFITGRVVFGHLPDRYGARLALFCAVIEAIGLTLIWLAPWSMAAFFGASLTGVGYSLVYPSFGVEAVRNTPQQSSGIVMGTYTAFLDLALGLANPALGLVAGGTGYGAVFLVSAIIVLCTVVVGVRLLKAQTDTRNIVHRGYVQQ